MVILSVLYPAQPAKHFDEAYFHATHLQLVRDVWGKHVAELRVLRGMSGVPGGAPAFGTIVEIGFASQAAFEAAMAEPRSAEVTGDVANYTDIVPIAQISRAA